MRALYNTRAGDTDVLEVREVPDPQPAAGEVRIRVKRAGLNFADVSARVGLYPDAPKFPMVMGYEVAGVIDSIGSGVSGFSEGERVLAMCRFHGQATHRCVPIDQVHRLPAKMSFDEAAALPVNYLTAFHMLFWVAPLQPGMTVLIHMAAGGVGLAALQLCRTVPNITVFGSASAGKHAFLREKGVTHPIDYRTEDYVEVVKRVTKGRGVDRVLDALGGDDWNRSYSALSPGGTVMVFGWANMVDGGSRNVLHVAREFLRMKRYSPMQLMRTNRGLAGINMGHMWKEGPLMRSHTERLLALFEAGSIAPIVDSVFPLAKATDAHAHIQSRKNVGKVLFDCEG